MKNSLYNATSAQPTIPDVDASTRTTSVGAGFAADALEPVLDSLIERLKHGKITRQQIIEELKDLRHSMLSQMSDSRFQMSEGAHGSRDGACAVGQQETTKTAVNTSKTGAKNQISLENIEGEEVPPMSDWSHARAVIVAGDAGQLASMSATLTEIFGKVFEASNGPDALTLVKNITPDIIITTSALPGMSGVELTEWLKASNLYSHIPVLMLVDGNVEKYIAAGADYGADGYVPLPVDSRLLKARSISLLKSFDRIREWYKSRLTWLQPESGKRSNDDETFLLRVREVVHNNISQPGFGVDRIVESLLVSRSTLYKRFKELTGTSLGAYINGYKIENAKRMLLDTDMTMNEISDTLGFNSQRYFSTFFRERTGSTPTDFRNAHGNT